MGEWYKLYSGVYGAFFIILMHVIFWHNNIKDYSRCKISILQNEGVIGSFSYEINGGKRYCREKSLTKHVARGTSARLNPTVCLRRRRERKKENLGFLYGSSRYKDGNG